ERGYFYLLKSLTNNCYGGRANETTNHTFYIFLKRFMVTNKKYRGLFIVKTKKWFQVVGIALMSFMLIYLVGCQDNDNENASDNSGDKNNAAENSNGNADSDDEEPFPISIMTMTHNPDPPTSDSPNIEALEDYTNTELDITFVPGDYDDRFNITLGSGDLPSIMLADKTPSFIQAARD